MNKQGVAWVWEYSGNDCSWKMYRTTKVSIKKRRVYDRQDLGH